jgi:hypothetical protein
MAYVEPINIGFSTADAQYPELRASAGTLWLSFLDWQEQRIEVAFREVCAYRWQEIESLLPNEPYDGSCEVHQSEWVAQHLAQGVVPSDAQLRHLRLNFNACGQLEILCVSFAVNAGVVREA